MILSIQKQHISLRLAFFNATSNGLQKRTPLSPTHLWSGGFFLVCIRTLHRAPSVAPSLCRRRVIVGCDKWSKALTSCLPPTPVYPRLPPSTPRHALLTAQASTGTPRPLRPRPGSRIVLLIDTNFVPPFPLTTAGEWQIEPTPQS